MEDGCILCIFSIELKFFFTIVSKYSMNCVWARSTLPSLLSANVTAINCVTEDPQRCTFSLSVRRRRSERYNKCELNLCSKFQSDCDTWTQFTNVIITDKTDNVSFGNLYFRRCHNKTQMWGIYSVSKTLNIWLLQFTAKWSQLSQIWTYCTWNTCRHPKLTSRNSHGCTTSLRTISVFHFTVILS